MKLAIPIPKCVFVAIYGAKHFERCVVRRVCSWSKGRGDFFTVVESHILKNKVVKKKQIEV